MAYLLPHLRSGYAVDQAIVNEEERVVVIRFGHDSDETCMLQDECLMSIAEKVKNFGVVYCVDITGECWEVCGVGWGGEVVGGEWLCSIVLVVK